MYKKMNIEYKVPLLNDDFGDIENIILNLNENNKIETIYTVSMYKNKSNCKNLHIEDIETHTNSFKNKNILCYLFQKPNQFIYSIRTSYIDEINDNKMELLFEHATNIYSLLKLKVCGIEINTKFKTISYSIDKVSVAKINILKPDLNKIKYGMVYDGKIRLITEHMVEIEKRITNNTLEDLNIYEDRTYSNELEPIINVLHTHYFKRVLKL